MVKPKTPTVPAGVVRVVIEVEFNSTDFGYWMENWEEIREKIAEQGYVKSALATLPGNVMELPV